MKKKILIVGSFKAKEYGVIGGIARSCEELMDSDFSSYFDVITVDSTQRSNPPPSFFVRLVFSILRMLKFVVVFFRVRPDGVLLFASDGFSFFEKSSMGWFSKFFGSKVFVFPRAGRLMSWAASSNFNGLLLRTMFKGSDVFLAQGPSWAKFAIECGGFKKSSVVTIPNWTANPSHILEGYNKLASIPIDRPPTIAFVGWLEKEKGVIELIESCAELAADGLDFKVIFAGDGSKRTELCRLIIEHDLNDKVTLEGWVEGEKLFDIFRRSDIFVLPSWSEGLPNALIEAMSFALCPVVTRVGMIPDYISDGVHGSLVDPKDIAGLSSALRVVIKNNELRKSYSVAAHDLAKSFSSENVIPILCAVIDQNLS